MDQKSTSTSIMRQLQVVFGISILILLISSYASFYSNRKLIDASAWVNHTNEIIKKSELLISSTKDAETGQRGFIITNDPAFLRPYNGAYQRVMSIYDELKGLTDDNPTQRQNLEVARALVDQRFEQMEKVLAVAKSSELSERAKLFVSSHEEMEKGMLLMDQLRAQVDKMKTEENRLLRERTTSLETYTKVTPVLVILASLVSILISILAYFRIKSDLDARIKKQQEEQAKYIETTSRISEMEKITNAIANGDYATRSNDSAKDELGRIAAALNAMAESLEINFTELETRNWLQTGTVNVTNSIRGERLVSSLSEKLLTAVAEYINAQVATIYLSTSGQQLVLNSSYGATHAPREMDQTQGLIGQATKGKELIISDQLPNDYLKIASSIGSTTPVYAMVLPLMYANTVIAVIELGLLRKPTDTEISFLKDNAESMGIALNAAINYEQIQNLLEETQAQAEELQVQHSELENLNTELEAQAQKLQASEEELRVQQEELLQANQELEERSKLLEERNQLILEKNLDIQKKAEDLELSTKYKSEFLANMSHELRTPLNSILLLSRLMAENTSNNLTEEQVEYAKVIQSSGHGLLALIDEILDLSKIESGKMDLEYLVVPVNDIVIDMKNLFNPIAKDKGLDLVIDVADNTPNIIETDKMRLEQILRNLLSNALKFTTQGSVTLQVAPDKARDGIIRFSVRDTGIGIPKEKHAHVFEAFQQADGSTRRKFGGTGLGLSISRELAKLLGGKIMLESEPGKGSEFSIYVPIRKPTEAEQMAEVLTEQKEVQVPQASSIAPIRKRVYAEYIADNIPENIPDDRAVVSTEDNVILIVEDDTSFAKALLDFTHQKGYKGITTVRGDEALDLARKHMPIGILLDVQLPIKSGWEVMEDLKNDPHTRHIPVHIMSSHHVKKESLMKGAVDFINKPVAFEQMQEVFRKIENVINKENKKVLIVEENTKHASALSYFLEQYKINAEISNTVADGISALNKEDIDCVILDMGIPHSNAYETLEKIKENPGLENLPIIIFTGKSLSKAEEMKIRSFADSIVVKTAHSYKRILDEVTLFLHLVEENNKSSNGSSTSKTLGRIQDVLKNKTVLIADDDVRNIFSLTKILEGEGMNIVSATDGKEALNALEANKKVDVILMDIMMPEMDGYEAIRAIRQKPKYNNLPIIAVTAKAMVGDREKCIEAGASDYITKPVDIDQLLSLLRVWIYDRAF